MDTVPNLLPFGLEVNAAGVHAVEQSAEQRAEQRDAQAPLRPEQIISAFAQLADGAQRLSALPQETSLFDVLLTRPEITFEGVTVKLYRRAEVPNDHLHLLINEMQSVRMRHERGRTPHTISLFDVVCIGAALLTLVCKAEECTRGMFHSHDDGLHDDRGRIFLTLLAVVMACLLPPEMKDVAGGMQHPIHTVRREMKSLLTGGMGGLHELKHAVSHECILHYVEPHLMTREHTLLYDLLCTLDVSTWPELRAKPMLQAVFAFQDIARISRTPPAEPGVPSLVRLSSRAILPADVTDASFAQSMLNVHSLLVRSRDHTIEASLSSWKDLWAPLGWHVAAWLARVRQQKAQRDRVEMALLCTDALGRLTRLHAASSPLLEDWQGAVAQLEQTRSAAILYITKHVGVLTDAVSGEPAPLASLLLPTSLAGGAVPLHPATIAAVNALRVEHGHFAELYDQHASEDLEWLDRSLVAEAESLAGFRGLSVRFPLAGRVLGGKWRCTLEQPVERESPVKKRKTGVRLQLATRLVVDGGISAGDRPPLTECAPPLAAVACSLSLFPAPYHFEMLFTNSVLKGHSPRVRFTPPNVPISPLVHAPSGLVSPLALEHLELVLREGSSVIPTAETVLTLLELLVSDAPLGTLVAACSVNEDACWGLGSCVP